MSLASPSISGGRSHTPVKCISFPLLPCPVPALAPRSPRLGDGCWAWGSGDVPRGIPPARLSFRKTSSRRSICLGFFLANSSTSEGLENTDCGTQAGTTICVNCVSAIWALSSTHRPVTHDLKKEFSILVTTFIFFFGWKLKENGHIQWLYLFCSNGGSRWFLATV